MIPQVLDALHHAADADAAFRLARGVEDGGDAAAAELAYRLVLERFPGEVRACNNLGMLLEAVGRTEEAEALFRAALERDPDASPVLLNLGTLEHGRGRRDEAEALYRRVLERTPDAVPALMNLARLQFDRGDFERAAASLERAAAVEPDSPALETAYGTVLFEQGRLRDALTRFERALALDPGAAEKHFHVGRVLDSMGRHDEAIAAYRASLAIRGESVVVHERLARLLVETGRRDEAEVLLREWLAAEPGQPVATHFLASMGAVPPPPRAADDYVSLVFDRFADDFDTTLERLQYRAPERVAEAVRSHLGEPAAAATMLDAGCGTGLCAPLIRPWARTLVGVDLSRGMLDRARARGGYDLLVRAELTAFLSARAAVWDLIVSADTLVYFGDLDAVLRGAARALRPGGWMVFSLERAEPRPGGAPFELQLHGRYRHREDHAAAAVRKAGLTLVAAEAFTPRLESARPVEGLLVVARRS